MEDVPVAKKVGETRIFTNEGESIIIPVIEIQTEVKKKPLPVKYFKRVKHKKP